MIWLLWGIFIELETTAHWFVINILLFDLTPDKRIVTLSKALVIAARLGVYYWLWYKLGVHYNYEYWCFTLGAFCTHTLIFPIQLNLMSNKPAHYLGKGLFDRALDKVFFSSLAWRVWCLLVLSGTAIYTYYNTDLLP